MEHCLQGLAILLARVLHQTADSLLQTGGRPCAAEQQEEEERLCKLNQALNVFYDMN